MSGILKLAGRFVAKYGTEVTSTLMEAKELELKQLAYNVCGDLDIDFSRVAVHAKPIEGGFDVGVAVVCQAPDKDGLNRAMNHIVQLFRKGNPSAQLKVVRPEDTFLVVEFTLLD